MPQQVDLEAKLLQIIDRDGGRVADAMCKAIVRKALDGDPKFLAMMWDIHTSRSGKKKYRKHDPLPRIVPDDQHAQEA